MARKRRHGGRGFRVGKWINLAFKLFGAAVAIGPGAEAVWDHKESPADIPKYVLFNYTGIQSDGKIDTSKTASGVGSLLGGVLIAKIGSFLGRRF